MCFFLKQNSRKKMTKEVKMDFVKSNFKVANLLNFKGFLMVLETDTT